MAIQVGAHYLEKMSGGRGILLGGVPGVPAARVVIIGGGVGTLNELTIAYDEGRPVGIVTNSGGISNAVPHIIEELCLREIPPNMVFDDDPVALLDKLEVAIRAFPLPLVKDFRVRGDEKRPG